jgi:hypothetical protein
MLSGNLELFPLTDVLRFVARSGATGTVNVHRPGDAGRVLLVEGEVVGVEVEGLEAADLDAAIDLGVRLLEPEGGEFSLDLEPATGPVRLPVEEFLAEVARRRVEWQKILGSLGPLDRPLQVVPLVPEGASEITLTPLEWQVAVLADGRRALRDLAADSRSSEFAVARALLAMAAAGLLEIPSAEAAWPDDPTAEPQAPAREPAPPLARPAPPAAARPEPSGARAADDEEEDEDDVDPAELLRELGERPPGPRPRPALRPTREEQRLRLRSR